MKVIVIEDAETGERVGNRCYDNISYCRRAISHLKQHKHKNRRLQPHIVSAVSIYAPAFDLFFRRAK